MAENCTYSMDEKIEAGRENWKVKKVVDWIATKILSKLNNELFDFFCWNECVNAMPNFEYVLVFQKYKMKII